MTTTNHFRKNGGVAKTSSPAIAVKSNLLAPLSESKMGLFSAMAVNHRRSKANKNIAIHEIDRTEAAIKETVNTAVTTQAAIAKVEIVRESSTQLAAVTSELQQNATATYLELAGERILGTKANLQMKGQQFAEVQRAVSRGECSEDDGAAMRKTIEDVFLHTEDVIEDSFQQSSKTVQRVFNMAHKTALDFETN